MEGLDARRALSIQVTEAKGGSIARGIGTAEEQWIKGFQMWRMEKECEVYNLTESINKQSLTFCCGDELKAERPSVTLDSRTGSFVVIPASCPLEMETHPSMRAQDSY